MTMKLTISLGNSKLGKIPNLSLTPGLSCKPGVPCFTDGCYAMKSYRMYPKVREAWDGNLALYREHPGQFWMQLGEWLLEHEPTRFRYHVGGDAPDREYFDQMIWVATRFPRIDFLAFTKRADILSGFNIPQALPPNLSLVLSTWPGIPAQQLEGIPRAWLSEDLRKPAEYFKCRGDCRSCSRCWDAVRLGIDIVFDRH